MEGGERGSTEFDCKVAGSTLSHHIKQLREAGILQHRKEGTRCFVSLRPELEQVFPGLLELVLRFAPKDAARSLTAPARPPLPARQQPATRRPTPSPSPAAPPSSAGCRSTAGRP